MTEKLNDGEVLKKVAERSLCGFRRRRKGMPIPKWFDFGERVEWVLADPGWSLLSRGEVEEEEK
ncbi:hypothetical protein ACFL3T_02860 [Patescibacteria group bacterium]